MTEAWTIVVPAKGTAADPVTGAPVELLWVKGSGGDLGTLTEPGLAVLRLDRPRSLTTVFPGVDREDELQVDAGAGGAGAPRYERQERRGEERRDLERRPVPHRLSPAAGRRSPRRCSRRP